MDIKRVTVLGAGIMGHGIAQVCAMAGISVKLRDLNEELVQVGMKQIEESLTRLIKSGKKNKDEASQIMEKIIPLVDLKEALSDAELVIEAIPENLEVKKKFLGDCDKIASPQTIFGSNTSNFSITALASATQRPDRFIGIHFFNPPVIMKLIEITCGLKTSKDTLEYIKAFAQKVGKEFVVCNKDSTGFITSRMIQIWLTEAERLYEEGVASIEDIDKACRLAFNHPMGPFQITDLSGLDTKLFVGQSLEQNFGERFKSSQSLKNRIAAGLLGRKSGGGWYQY